MKKILLLTFLLLLLLLAACAAQPSEDVADGPITFSKYGVRFGFYPGLMTGTEGEIVPAQIGDVESGFVYEFAPEHLRFTLIDDLAEDIILYRQPINIPDKRQILIYEVEDYEEVNPLAKEQIDALRVLLAKHANASDDILPHLPPPNGQQDLRVQIEFLSFENGDGVRYLTQYNQEPRQINNQEIYYTFQGLTKDGKYYVAAFFPVQNAILSAENDIADDGSFAAGMVAYLAQTTEALNGQPSNNFEPDLALIDTLIRSLKVEPTTPFNAGSTATE